MNVRLADETDLPSIVELSNWAAMNTPANFAIEPETLDAWRRDYDATHAMHPWLVAENPLPSRGEGRERGDADEPSTTDTLPPAPSLPRNFGRGSFVGFAKSSPWKGRCAYSWSAEVTVYVQPEQHGRGIGKALYTRLIEILKTQGYRTLLGGITQPNEASVRLHESFGFRRVALLERVGWKFGKWHDVGYWELILGDPGTPPEKIRSVPEAVEALTH